MEHFTAHEIEVGVGLTLEFRGNCMRPEEGPNDIDARGPTRLRRDAQYLELVRGPQSVSALHLDRRRPEGEHRPEALRRRSDQIFLAGVPRRSHGVENAASASRDFSIPHSFRLPVNLVLPGSGEDGIRVRIYEARQDRLSGRVDGHTRTTMSTEHLRRRSAVD